VNLRYEFHCTLKLSPILSTKPQTKTPQWTSIEIKKTWVSQDHSTITIFVIPNHYDGRSFYHCRSPGGWGIGSKGERTLRLFVPWWLTGTGTAMAQETIATRRTKASRGCIPMDWFLGKRLRDREDGIWESMSIFSVTFVGYHPSPSIAQQGWPGSSGKRSGRYRKLDGPLNMTRHSISQRHLTISKWRGIMPSRPSLKS